MHNAFAAVSSSFTVHGNSHAWAPQESVFVAIEFLKAYSVHLDDCKYLDRNYADTYSWTADNRPGLDTNTFVQVQYSMRSEGLLLPKEPQAGPAPNSERVPCITHPAFPCRRL